MDLKLLPTYSSEYFPNKVEVRRVSLEILNQEKGCANKPEIQHLNLTLNHINGRNPQIL
jgi:hypothetical protein